MSRISYLALAASVTLLAACAQESMAPPVSNSRSGSSAQAPQSPNSLPAGTATTAPLTPATGVVGTTRVGPR